MEAIIPAILNELSVETKAPNKEVAREIIQKFVYTCISAKEIGFAPLRYAQNILSILLAEDYSIGQALTDEHIAREMRTKLRNLATATPFLKPSETDLDQALLRHYFHIEGDIAEGLGVAVLKKTLAISFDVHEKWNLSCLKVQNIDTDTQYEIKHAANPEHIKELVLDFKFHPKKHGICGNNAEKGQNKMYCCSETEASRLLNTALPHPNRQWLCNYDEKNKRFIVFPKTNPNQNEYHGFHYENEPHTDSDRDLNGKNGIPLDFQVFLKQRLNIHQ